MPEVAELPVVVGLGLVDPALVNPVLGGHCRFVPEPTEADLAQAFTRLAAAGQLAGYEATERFYEIGTPEALAETDAFLSGRAASGAPGSRRRRGMLGGPSRRFTVPQCTGTIAVAPRRS